MKNEELNQYILHYLTDDKTNSAIMLTGDWGTGKSYYIQHSLKPFLEKDENGKHQCVIVSLYGLNDTAEISKSIYLGTRLKFLNAASEKATTVRFAGKTIVKSVAGFFGVDLSQDEDALEQLYASVDLTGKLIILEDLERSGIDILEVLGYVNSLVEQDGVKILLVANENEIIQYESIVSEKKEPQTLDDQFNQIAHEDEKRLTETAQKYREAKEKTVSDTIIFEGNFGEAAKQIIGAYNSPNLTAIAEADGLTEIITVCRDIGVTNLRTFVFASQKAADIFQIINLDYTEDEDYIKTVFFGILAFSHKMKSGKEIAWSNDNDFSMELGMKKYPLFRSCYNYIRWQAFDADRVDDEKDALNKLRLYDDKTITSDLDLQIIYSWWLHTEAEVLASVEAISVKLNKKESEKENADKIITSLAIQLNENPAVNILIKGYIAAPPQSLTNDLSLQRAETIKNMLVEKGVDSSRISVIGAGMGPYPLYSPLNRYCTIEKVN